ncbi:hypothetical protein ACNAN0_11455 [Agrilactobacillus fermenti]|uniref:hypothetical protein n=1 Tax=Agrilactobacillus fermenti TaxID=2586909 RepID=UPI003A5BAA6A
MVNIFNLSGSHYLIENIKQALAASGGGSLHVLRVIGSTATHYTGQQSLVFPMIRLTATDWVNISVLLCLSCLLVLLAVLFLEHRPLVLKPAKRRDPIKITKPWVTSFKQSRLYLAFRLLTGDVSRYWLWLLLITWLWSWTTTTYQMRHLALPLLFLLAIPLFANLGATAVQTGVAQWLQTVPDGQRRQKWWASISGWLLALGLILPAVQQTTVMAYLALLIWALQLPLVAQLIGRLTRSQRPFQVILVVFFYLYLNGAPLLPFDQAHLFLPTLLYLSIGSLAALGLFGLKNNAFN